MLKRRHAYHVAQLDRYRLLYRCYGDGPPVVLVHGLVGSARWWRYNVPALADHFRVYVIELVGFGSNRAWRPARIAASAELLARFIADLPEGRAAVIGHSMGGQIAIHLAARAPERVHRLVLAAASVLLRSDLVRMALRLPRAGLALRPDFVPTLALDAVRCGPLNLLLSAREILADDVQALLARIVAPTLLIWAERDALVPVAVGAALQQAIPTARLQVISGAGHVVMWDRPTEFNRLVLEFLRAPEQATAPPALPAAEQT